MRSNLACTSLTFLSTVVLLALPTPRAHAAACSTATAAGTYAVSDTGTVIGIGSRAAVALLTLDVAGNVSGKVTANLNGNVTSTTLSGTYAVNPDCTGTTSFEELDQSGNLILNATVDLVWDDNLRELRFLFTSVALPDGIPLATVISGSGRKLVP